MLDKTRMLIESKPTYGDLSLTGVWDHKISESGKTKSLIVECECSCGDVGFYRLGNLKSGNTIKCFNHDTKCLIKSKPTYNELTLTGKYHMKTVESGNKYLYVECECSCGTISDYILGDIKRGNIKRCKGHMSKITIGKTYNDITISSLSHYDKQGKAIMNYICSCGSLGKGNYYSIKEGLIKKCKMHSVTISIGKKYNGLTVLSYSYRDDNHDSYVNCECECGDINTYKLTSVKTGQVKYCSNHYINTSLGKKYNELFVVSYSHKDKYNNVYVNTECVCGNIRVQSLASIRNNYIKSCGCQSWRNGGTRRPEVLFMNEIEPLLETRGLTLERQYNVNGYFIDGYIPELNLALEYDEYHHNKPSQKIKDETRELDIKSELGCDFLRFNYKLTNKEIINILFDHIISLD